MPIKGINHVTLRVRSLEEARKFYELLGFHETGSREGMLFLAVNSHHHHIALVEMGPEAVRPPKNSVGGHHFAVTVEHETEIGDLYRKLHAAGYSTGSVMDHTTNRGFYTKDADDNVVEITFDAPREEWADMDNPFLEDRPYTIPGE